MERMMDNETFDEVLNGFKEADNIVKRLKTRIAELEEENKKLREENKKLREELEHYKNTEAIQKSNAASRYKYPSTSYVDRELNVIP